MSFVKSAKRVLEILELFERLRRPAGVNEIAELLGYPQSSTSMLVNSLRSQGYLSYNPTDRNFAPSMRIALIGEWIRLGDIGSADLLSMMKGLQRDTGGTVVLSSRQGSQVQYIHIVEPKTVSVLALKPDRRQLVCAGALRPICRVAAGLTILADYSNGEISKLVRGMNAQADVKAHEDLTRVMRDVERTRLRGYACRTAGVHPSVGSIAVRLPYNDIFGKPLALSVLGPSNWIRNNEEALAQTMRDGISAHLAMSEERSARATRNGRTDVKRRGSPSRATTDGYSPNSDGPSSDNRRRVIVGTAFNTAPNRTNKKK